MTEYELEGVIRKAFDHALDVGAPGLTGTLRAAVVNNAMRRIRHQLNMPPPDLSQSSAMSESK